jgi:RNA-binding protein
MDRGSRCPLLRASDRRHLRQLAHGQRALVQVGAAGVTAHVVEALDRALSDHELVKVRIDADRQARARFADALARGTASALAGRVGRMAIFYRPAPNRTQRRIALPSLAAAPDGAPEPAVSTPKPRVGEPRPPRGSRAEAARPAVESRAARANTRWSRWLFGGVVALLALVVFVAVRHTLGLDLKPDSIRASVSSAGIWAPLVYIGVVAFRVPLGLPSQLVLVGGGLMFGARAGSFYGAIGLVTSALALFAASRRLGRHRLRARNSARLAGAMDIAGSRLGAVFVAVGTGYPLGPITVYHAMAGFTSMSLAAFALAVTLGSAARATTFAFFGSSLLSGRIDLILYAVLVMALAGLLPLAFSRPRGWLLHLLGGRAGIPSPRFD